MILHCVFCNIDPDASRADLQQVLTGLSNLCDNLDGALDFQTGPNLDFEGKSPDHSDGFVIRFTDAAALNRYATDPRHKALGAQLCTLCTGGGDGIIVYDLNIST